MLKKLYDKSKIWFAVAWIVLYCVLLSLGDSISAIIGVEKAVTLPIGILLSAILLLFLKKNQCMLKRIFQTWSTKKSLNATLYDANL